MQEVSEARRRHGPRLIVILRPPRSTAAPFTAMFRQEVASMFWHRANVVRHEKAPRCATPNPQNARSTCHSQETKDAVL